MAQPCRAVLCHPSASQHEFARHNLGGLQGATWSLLPEQQVRTRLANVGAAACYQALAVCSLYVYGLAS